MNQPVGPRVILSVVILRGGSKRQGLAAVQGIDADERDDPAGDPAEAVVRAVYAEHGTALLGYALRLTRDRGAAEDLVQETVLRAWRHTDQLLADGRPLRPWLFTVMGNLASDRRRASRSRPAEVGGELLEELPAEDELDRAIQSWQVADALAGLSPEHRAVLLETYYRGSSVAEAARVLGIPAGTVKSRSYYALRALHLALEERGWST
ncbi:MAG: polymerase, sigma-24 subunit, subfamily [Frankiales bacterium]|nr:polymerase, sigma-24 subunit, subfamily [Frankiales bacterium]